MTTIAQAWGKGREVAAQRPRAQRTPVLALLFGWIAAHLPVWSRVRTPIMQIGAFASICYGLFQVSAVAGFVAVGVSLLVLDLVSGERK